jgi:hypothetical protein
MKKILGIMVLIVFMIGAMLSPSFTNSATTSPQRFIIPAYYLSTTIWNTTYSNVGSGDIAVINPYNGPSTAKSSVYAAVVTKLNSLGATPCGYVYSSYGARSAAAIKADIDTYYSWYGIKTIFIDEVSTSTAYLSYYADLYNYIKTRSGKVIINPGTVPNEAYMGVSDIAIIFESSYASYGSWSSPAWATKYDPSKIAHLVYGCTSANLSNAVALSKSRGAGYLYITDDALPNPWDTLPAYIATEKSLFVGTVTVTPSPLPP